MTQGTKNHIHEDFLEYKNNRSRGAEGENRKTTKGEEYYVGASDYTVGGGDEGLSQYV